MPRIYTRLDEILRQRSMTQKVLAEKAGVSRNAISRLSRHPRLIHLPTIEKICNVLDVDPGDIIVRDKGGP